MAHYKRKKSRRNIRCAFCTDARLGNSKKQEGRGSQLRLEEKIKHGKNDYP
jgi:hypothetical protein